MKRIILVVAGISIIIVTMYIYSSNLLAQINHDINLKDLSIYAFVMTDKYELATIDTRTDKVVRLTNIGENVTNPTLDLSGGYVYLTSGKSFMSPLGEYFIVYSIKDNRMIKKIDMPFPAPADIEIIDVNGQKKIFITSRDYGKDFGAGITVMSSDFEIIGKYHLKEPYEILDYTLVSSVDNTRLFGLSDSGEIGTMNSITLRVIDTNKGDIIKDVPIKGWWGSNGIVNVYEGKIYISTQTHTLVSNESQPLSFEERAKIFTAEILVYSDKDYKLLKIIPVSKIPRMMAYFPKQKKLFVEHNNEQGLYNEIEIIDTQTDAVVDTIKNIHPWGVFRVSENKLYMIVHGEEEGIKVWDVDKNKFTGFIKGSFGGGISSYPLKPLIN